LVQSKNEPLSSQWTIWIKVLSVPSYMSTELNLSKKCFLSVTLEQSLPTTTGVMATTQLCTNVWKLGEHEGPSDVRVRFLLNTTSQVARWLGAAGTKATPELLENHSMHMCADGARGDGIQP
jgi:hypothetical protein